MCCSELEYDSNGKLTINFDYGHSAAVCYLSAFASDTREVHFNITFPNPGYNDSDLARVTEEIEDVVNVIDNEFTNVSQFEATFFLNRLDVNQLSSARAFQRLRLSGCQLTYFVENEWQDTVDVDSNWLADLESLYGEANYSNYYPSDSDEGGEIWTASDSD
ncbi:hypothetical protein BCIN_03g03950 [Botrytis cinerea B05.10]|uniref:Uncharacterized protein n=1 Tax=Botryotinia fuckeliana (strain B05.10) TaxID=332648 RepID=A0A384JC18_BOTFB|nr:hypothetical protein BCIN_03g03950 [Botrytis cinerea B05.10]ATZ48149.1 hypothetical protein BCIN_03g03950 [Botrytis cinerea B05.10]